LKPLRLSAALVLSWFSAAWNSRPMYQGTNTPVLFTNPGTRAKVINELKFFIQEVKDTEEIAVQPSSIYGKARRTTHLLRM